MLTTDYAEFQPASQLKQRIIEQMLDVHDDNRITYDEYSHILSVLKLKVTCEGNGIMNTEVNVRRYLWLYCMPP